MIFWEKIYEKNIILWESKQENFAKIITITQLKLNWVLSEKFILANQSYIWLYLSYLEEILKIFKKDKELFFLIRDNWQGISSNSTKDKKNINDFLWCDWRWEKFLKYFSIVQKYKRISKKSWTIILLKIDTSKIIIQKEIDEYKRLH